MCRQRFRGAAAQFMDTDMLCAHLYTYGLHGVAHACRLHLRKLGTPMVVCEEAAGFPRMFDSVFARGCPPPPPDRTSIPGARADEVIVTFGAPQTMRGCGLASIVVLRENESRRRSIVRSRESPHAPSNHTGSRVHSVQCGVGVIRRQAFQCSLCEQLVARSDCGPRPSQRPACQAVPVRPPCPMARGCSICGALPARPSCIAAPGSC